MTRRPDAGLVACARVVICDRLLMVGVGEPYAGLTDSNCCDAGLQLLPVADVQFGTQCHQHRGKLVWGTYGAWTGRRRTYGVIFSHLQVRQWGLSVCKRLHFIVKRVADFSAGC